MLSITNLSVSSLEKPIVRRVNLVIRRGELHFLMGPNGAGKSTLAFAIMGHPRYQITTGQIRFRRKNILHLDPSARARLGIFLGFQHPLEYEGVRMHEFLRNAYEKRFFESIPPFKFRRTMQNSIVRLGWDEAFLERYLNKDFSGGEKKRSELFQLSVLKPEIAILDEFDSGLDVEALRSAVKTVRRVAREGTGLLIVTHNPRIIKYLTPDAVHIMVDGSIVKEGGRELISHIDKHGYKDFI